MKEVKKYNHFKEKDEIDAYFSDAKKKGIPISLIFIFLVICCIGALGYYYFIIDNPKNIFLTVLNDKFGNINITKEEYKKINTNYSVDINMDTNNKEYKKIVDILNDISLSGNTWIDYNETKTYSMINTYYQKEDLLSLGYLYEKDTMYIKLNELYDKIISLKLSEEEKKEMTETFKTHNKENYISFLESIINHFKTLFLNAEYNKEYTKLDNNFVKKITLKINKTLMEQLYDNLINDKKFLDNYVLLTNMKEEEIIEELKQNKENLNEEYEIISIYISILENKFIMLENIYGNDKLTITKDGNDYIYKIYEDSIIGYQGYISIEKFNDEHKISFSIEDIEEEINIELNISLEIEYDAIMKSFDTNNKIDYEKMTENDINKIINNLKKNDTLLSLYEDIYILYSDQEEKYPKTA